MMREFDMVEAVVVAAHHLKRGERGLCFMKFC